MKIVELTGEHLTDVMDLFCDCFRDDPYYSKMFRDPKTKSSEMRKEFGGNVKFCIDHGICYGMVDGEKLIAFLLSFDYSKTKAQFRGDFFEIFGGDPSDDCSLPFYEQLHKRIETIDSSAIFCLSIAVDEKYRSRGVASALLERVMSDHDGRAIVGDVSNKDSLGMYLKRGFELTAIDSEYYYICRCEGCKRSFSFEKERITLILPSTKILVDYDISFDIVKKEQVIGDVKVVTCLDQSYFECSRGDVATAVSVSVLYKDLLRFQRVINLAQNTEHIFGDALYYVMNRPYEDPPLINDTLAEMLKSRKREWDVIPDIYVSVPVQYSRDVLFDEVCTDRNTADILRILEFRTQHEAGVPFVGGNVDELSNLKNRIKRYYLGKYKIRILSEIDIDNYEVSTDVIGSPAWTDIYISVDSDSDCAVVTWISLSSPFIISQYMDNITRNQLMICDTDGLWVNIFDFFSNKFGIIKRGTSKIFATIPESRHCFTDSQLASVLAAETIYPEGENFGSIIDRDIVEAVRSSVGIGQYDRGFVCAYTNVVLQFSPDFRALVKDRLNEESITLFYIELILMEEAAIHIADSSIVHLLGSGKFSEPISFLKQVDLIQDNYAKTIDFWDIQVNYPTSQKSMAMLRGAFKTKEQLENMQRNQEYLQTIFNTKSDIIDRTDSKRMDTSLAILSVLAVFSALVDGYAYIDTWGGHISELAVSLLKNIFFVLIVGTALFVIVRMFGGKFASLFKKGNKRNSKDKRNR